MDWDVWFVGTSIEEVEEKGKRGSWRRLLYSI